MSEVTDLKEVLSETLQSNGTLDKLKAQLRAQVFAVLQEDEAAIKPPLSNANLIINELIREYLQYNQYNHTLSVLLPESGQPIEQFDRTFLANELGIEMNQYSKKVPLLYSILALQQYKPSSSKGEEQK